MAKKAQHQQFTTEEKATKYEMLFPMLEAVYIEIKELSKKKQDDVLNKLKVKMINRILEQVREILAGEPTIPFTELLDEEMLPSNSDTVLMLAQFKSAMVQFRAKYYGYDKEAMESRWFVK
jgi:hypothetical protein